MTNAACYAVLVDGAIDALWDTKRQADKEARDLRKMDCGKVTVRAFATWKDAEAYEVQQRGY